jgi:hypothetical protein
MFFVRSVYVVVRDCGETPHYLFHDTSWSELYSCTVRLHIILTYLTMCATCRRGLRELGHPAVPLGRGDLRQRDPGGAVLRLPLDRGEEVRRAPGGSRGQRPHVPVRRRRGLLPGGCAIRSGYMCGIWLLRAACTGWYEGVIGFQTCSVSSSCHVPFFTCDYVDS